MFKLKTKYVKITRFHTHKIEYVKKTSLETTMDPAAVNKVKYRQTRAGKNWVFKQNIKVLSVLGF